MGHCGPDAGSRLHRVLGDEQCATLVLLALGLVLGLVLLLVLGDGGCGGSRRRMTRVLKGRERGGSSQGSEAGGARPGGVPIGSLLSLRPRCEREAPERSVQRRRCRGVGLPFNEGNRGGEGQVRRMLKE